MWHMAKIIIMKMAYQWHQLAWRNGVMAKAKRNGSSITTEMAA